MKVVFGTIVAFDGRSHVDVGCLALTVRLPFIVRGRVFGVVDVVEVDPTELMAD